MGLGGTIGLSLVTYRLAIKALLDGKGHSLHFTCAFVAQFIRHITYHKGADIRLIECRTNERSLGQETRRNCCVESKLHSRIYFFFVLRFCNESLNGSTFRNPTFRFANQEAKLTGRPAHFPLLRLLLCLLSIYISGNTINTGVMHATCTTVRGTSLLPRQR